MRPRLRHKFNARPTIEDGIRFASKKEAEYYQKLKQFQEHGELLFFLMQVPIRLRCGKIYRVDFLEFWKDGTVKFVDVKGFKTEVYKLKKASVEAEYPFEIEEA